MTDPERITTLENRMNTADKQIVRLAYLVAKHLGVPEDKLDETLIDGTFDDMQQEGRRQ